MSARTSGRLRCACGHTELSHEVYRPGLLCANCECPAFRRRLVDDVAAALALLTRRHLVPITTQIVRSWWDRLNIRAGFRALEAIMAADRDLITALAQSLPALVAGVDSLAADRDSWKARALAAEGREATDEAGDTDALGPLRDGLAAIAAKLAPAVPVDSSDTATPLPIEDVPGVIDAAPEVTPVEDTTTSTDGEAAGTSGA